MNTLPPWGHVAQVALGGALGAFSRLSFNLIFPVLPGEIPWTTLAENALGALLLALALGVFLGTRPWRVDPRPLFTTGALGAFTTFSTLSVELLELLQGGHLGVALLYTLASVAAALGGAGVGLLLGERLALRLRRAAT